MPGGGEEKVLTLLKGFSERWRDRGRGREREWGNNEWVVEEERVRESEREMGEEEMALKTVDWRETGGGGWMAFSLVKTRCRKYPVTYFWTCQSLCSPWPFLCRWSLINSLYSLLFTMHEIGPSVRVWSAALSEPDILLLFFYSRLQWKYYREMKSSPLSKLQPDHFFFHREILLLVFLKRGFCPHLKLNGY